MTAISHRKRFALAAGAAIAACTLLSTQTILVASQAPAAPLALSANEAVAQITDAGGMLRFDVAEDGTRFVWAHPMFDDGLPARGATYFSQGYIYPAGTLSETVDGVNVDGSPEFPDKVLGDWYGYGWHISDGAHSTSGPRVLSTQYYNFGDAWGEASLISEGYVLSEVDGAVYRAITGGTGPFATVRGEMVNTSLGFNETKGSNARYAVQIQATPADTDPLSAEDFNQRPMQGA